MQEMLLWVAAAGGAVVAADRALTAVSNLGLWPSRFRRFDVARAREIVEEQEQQEAMRDLAHERAVLVKLAALAPQLEGLPAAVQEIRYQVTSNGGGSMRDDISAIKERLDIGNARFDSVEGRVAALEQRSA